MHLLLLAWLCVAGLVSPARAAEPDPALGPAPGAAFKDDKSKEEKEKEMTAAEKEAERKRKEKLARVIVLKWPEAKSVDYLDTTLQRNVKSRIARPEAQFFPEVDLYQNGRKVRDKTVVPAMQPAMVPDQNLQRVRAAVDEVAGVPWNGMQPSQWGIKAQEMRDLVELIWFVDKVEQREPLFLLYAQIGRAAENQNQNVPPFYEQIGNMPVNYYFYLAATLAYQDPALMSKLTDQELNGYVAFILQQLQQGAFPSLKIDFEQEGEDFSVEEFGKSYEIFLNGILTEPSEDGQMDIFLGRTDIYLKRKDSGHGLSERLEVSKLEDKIYFVRDTARKKMGVDFIEQLFLNPNECTPSLDGDILNYLAIYAKIHEKADIYIAVPEFGNPNKVWVWRYDRTTANLSLVQGSGGGFPVRFAIVAMGGIMYNPTMPTYDEGFIDETVQSNANDPTAGVNLQNAVDAEQQAAYIPLNIELRGHYNRLMVALGAEFGVNTNSDAPWAERYFTPGHMDATTGKVSTRTYYVPEDTDGDGVDDTYTQEEVQVIEEAYLHTLTINRNMYLGVSAVLGRDAGIGLGPRIGGRIGWTNVPHALQTTAHIGWAFAPPGIKGLGERVRPFVDLDGRIGATWPFKYSIAHVTDPVTIAPVFGLTAGLGTTF